MVPMLSYDTIKWLNVQDLIFQMNSKTNNAILASSASWNSAVSASEYNKDLECVELLTCGNLRPVLAYTYRDLV